MREACESIENKIVRHDSIDLVHEGTSLGRRERNEHEGME